MHRDLAGRIWITTGREGLFRIDNPAADVPQFVRYTVEDGLTSNNTRCAVDDLDGNIYVGTVRGVNKLDIRSGKFTYFGTADGLASDFVNTAFRDHSGTLWFGTMNGLSKFVPHSEPAGKVTPYHRSVSGVWLWPISPQGKTTFKSIFSAPAPAAHPTRSINTGLRV
jgi:ligand-binding sensor domain-containing protein